MKAALVLVAGFAAAAQPPAPLPRPVERKVLELVGTAEASATVEVRARVTGTVTRTPAKEGAAVKKGDLLVEIDPRPYQIELDAAKARVAAAEARARQAAAQLMATERAARVGIVPREEYETARAAAEAGKAEFEATKAAVQLAELNLSYTRLAAPIDGRVGRYLVTEGNLVTAANATTIITVVATDPVRVWFNVDERNLAAVAVGNKVEVGFAGEDGFPHAATLDLIEPVIDPATRTARCRATLPNPQGRFWPGMAARVRVTPAAGR